MWTLRLLGHCTLVGSSQTLRPERKSAALLAYLALEGPTSRARLGELLWPELEGKAQRNNLRQIVHRLRQTAGVLGGTDPLELRAAVDVLEFTAALHARRPPQNWEWREGTLLGSYDYDDCPDFAEWLFLERERWASLRLEALESEAERLEREGSLSEALRCARLMVEAEPISEAAYRRLMRLHYLLGDRAAALQVYAQAKETLYRELSVEPLLQTTELAQAIERGDTAFNPPTSPAIRWTPHPPLVGREREWSALEAAWARGQVIVVRGAPGLGKSRLLREFAASKGPYALYRARPGDRVVPYASFARFVRESLEARPEQLDSLDPWVCHELARLLPEAFPSQDPLPLSAAAAKLRFFQAMSRWVEQGNRGMVSVLIDDLQYFDSSSIEMVRYLLSSAFHEGLPAIPAFSRPRLLCSLRAGEVPELEGYLVEAAQAGLVALIDLKPLDELAVEQLVENLLPQPLELGARVYKSTGGNPFFVVETLRALVEQGDWLGPLPLVEQVSYLLEARLTKLSSEAQQLARLIAVAGEDYTSALASQVLDASPLRIAEREGELEGAEVISEARFTHDLMGEAVIQTTSPAIQRYLHARLAEFLEVSRGSPARIAYHWLAAAQPGRAWEPLLKAAETALEAGALAQARGWLEQLRHEAPPFLSRRASLHLGVLAIGQDMLQAEGLLLEVIGGANSQAEAFLQAEARAALAQLYAISGQTAQGLSIVLKAQQELPDGASTSLRATLLETEFQVRWRMGDLSSAERVLNEALELDPGPNRTVSLGLLLWSQGRYREEIAVLNQLLKSQQNSPWVGIAHNNIAFAHFALGELSEALAGFERALERATALGDLYDASLAQLNLGTTRISRGEYRRAMESLELALRGYTQVGSALGQAEAYSRLGLLHARAGHWEESWRCYTQALERMRPIGDTFRITYMLAGLSEAQVGCGDLEGAQSTAIEALTQAQQAPQPYALGYALMAMSLTHQRAEAYEKALTYAAEAVRLSERFEMAEHLARALVFAYDAQPTHPDARPGLLRALAIAQERGIPDLIWRAACRLPEEPPYAELAREAWARLEAQSPPGWVVCGPS